MIKMTNRTTRSKHNSKFTRRQFIECFSMAGFAISSGMAFFGCDPLEILSTPSMPIETEDDVPALIIGSGFGGAVTALRLGESGIRTMVLEQGRRWPITGTPFSRSLPPDGRSTWLRNKTALPFGPSFPITKYTGVLDRVDYPNMHVYRGTAVGGGSIVYGGISVIPPENLFYKIFPTGISYQELQPYYERVRHMLNLTTVPTDVAAAFPYKYARVFARHASNAGLEVTDVEQAIDWDIIRSEIAGTTAPSGILGEFFYGNNSLCKNTLDQNYLPMAEATGFVSIHPLHRVIDVTEENSGKYAVTVEQIDETGEVIARKQITTTYLFFAAGCVGTTELLVKARALGSLPNLNDEVGQGFGPNGGILFTCTTNESTGNPQGYPVIKGIRNYENAETISTIESLFFPTGFDHTCLFYLLMALDTERGHFFYDTATDKVELMYPAGTNDTAARAAIDFADRMNAANGSYLGTPEGFPIPLPELLKDSTYHPLGGMVMDKACDLYGRVHGYPRMYVMDGALLPGSCATANPAWTIAALAERNIERILTDDLTMNREKT